MLKILILIVLLFYSSIFAELFSSWTANRLIQFSLASYVSGYGVVDTTLQDGFKQIGKGSDEGNRDDKGTGNKVLCLRKD